MSDSTVTVVLIGSQTWKRKHVDWEISSSIRSTQKSSRSGLVGILLPSYSLTSENKCNPHTFPPRQNDNVKCGFATLYKWSNIPIDVQNWIHSAFEKRSKINLDNSHQLFANNRTGGQWQVRENLVDKTPALKRDFLTFDLI